MSEKLTPLNPEWDEFIDRLMLHIAIRENPEHHDYYHTDCDGSFRISRNIIENRFSEMDIESTIDYFKKNGWYCDCDVFDGCPLGLGKSKLERIE